jgi:glycosyltransferase involved in cell wall biosynthesis
MKIINIVHFPFDYVLQADETPEVRWETGSGGWCAVWRGNWSHLLADAVLREESGIAYEIWRPDLRADRVHTHVFENGLTYRLFPARSVRKFEPPRFASVLRSPLLMEHLRREASANRPVLHLNSSPLIDLNFRIVRRFGRLPVLVTLHGNQSLPNSRVPLYRSLKRSLVLSRWRAVNRGIRHVTYQNSDQRRMLRSAGLTVPMTRATMGCDFDFWRPAEGPREPGPPRFLMVCRLVPLKRVDVVLRIFAELAARFDFRLTIAGYGDPGTTGGLKELAAPLIGNGRVEFTGFLTPDPLRELYRKSDYYIMASTSEGCPVSVMEAMACGLKIITTKTGYTAELLAEHGAGLLLPTDDPAAWSEPIRRVLEGAPVPALDRAVAERHFDWKRVSRRFLEIYETVSNTGNRAG